MIRSTVLLIAIGGTIYTMQVDEPKHRHILTPEQVRRLKKVGNHSDLKNRSALFDRTLRCNEPDIIAHAVRMIEAGNLLRVKYLLESKDIDFENSHLGDEASFDVLVTAIEMGNVDACELLFAHNVRVNAPNPHIPSLTFLNRVIRKYNRAQDHQKICLFRLCKQLIQQGALVTYGCIRSAQVGNHEEIILLLANNLPRESLTH